MTDQAEMEENVRSALLAFVDFLYAVVFGLVLAKLFDEVITSQVHWLEKARKIALVSGVFYFLTWDWLHGRLLTLKNPYRGYWRFFIEALVAFGGYGAAQAAVEGKVMFLFYIGAILLFGVWWSKIALREHPDSGDNIELKFIQIYQSRSAFFVFLFLIYYQALIRNAAVWWFSPIIIFCGIVFVFLYEIEIGRAPGVLGGPGVPFFNRVIMDKLRNWLRQRRNK